MSIKKQPLAHEKVLSGLPLVSEKYDAYIGTELTFKCKGVSLELELLIIDGSCKREV